MFLKGLTCHEISYLKKQATLTIAVVFNSESYDFLDDSFFFSVSKDLFFFLNTLNK